MKYGRQGYGKGDLTLEPLLYSGDSSYWEGQVNTPPSPLPGAWPSLNRRLQCPGSQDPDTGTSMRLSSILVFPRQQSSSLTPWPGSILPQFPGDQAGA